MFGGDVVDGDMEQGEEAAEGRGRALHALEGLVVAEYLVFDLADAAGGSVAHDLLHLIFEDGEVREDGGFEVGHRVPFVGSVGERCEQWWGYERCGRSFDCVSRDETLRETSLRMTDFAVGMRENKQPQMQTQIPSGNEKQMGKPEWVRRWGGR